MKNVEQKLKQFIDLNIKLFSNLGNSEVEEINVSEFDTDIIDYLKAAKHNRFDYNDICVYYVERENEVWIENMNS